MLPSSRRLHGIASGQLLLCTTSPSKPDGFATSPSRGGFGKEDRLCAMPRAPLLGELAPQATGGFFQQPLTVLNLSVKT